MSTPHAEAPDSESWQPTQPAPMPAERKPPATLAQVLRTYRQATAPAPPADPIRGLEVREIDSETTFDRLFGDDAPPPR